MADHTTIFLILALAYCYLISLINNQLQRQEQQHQQAVQQTLQLSTLVQVQQDMLKQLAAQQMSVLNDKHHQEMQEKQYQLAVQQTSQFSALLQIQQDMQKQLTSTIQAKLPPLQDCSTAPTSGQYTISQSGKASCSFKVYCDMDTALGGWILFQRRFDGSVNFDCNWAEYEGGFGTLAGEFWFGLRKLNMLTSHNKWELRVDLEDFEGNHAYALYDEFKVGDNSSLYRLAIGSYSGTAGDSMEDFDKNNENDRQFTTKDQDNDEWPESDCDAACCRNGWWHRECAYANLNGLYLGEYSDSKTGMFWYEWKGFQSLKKSEMKIRPIA